MKKRTRLNRSLSLLLALVLLLGLAAPAFAADAEDEELVTKWDPNSDTMDVCQVLAGKNNGGDTQYSNYRIPGIVTTKKDTVIMYYEARMTSSDWADMDILAFRSTDGGETFGEPITLAAGVEARATMNNPIMIVGDDNILHFIYCVECAVCVTCGDAATSECTHGPGVYYRQSTDDGLTWSDPVNISDQTRPDIRYVMCTGPGHGICLSNGTLLVPVWLVEKENCTGAITSHHTASVSTLYSLDNGKTWQMGDIIPNDNTDGSAVLDPNESMAVETSDGRVMLNIRSGGGGYRALAWSPNGYSDWTTMEYDTDLIDPTCMGSVNKYDDGVNPYTVLLSHCESTSSRTNLVLRGSVDNGGSWPIRKVIDPGSAGYSDVTVDSKGTIYVLYEVNNGTTVNLARLNYDCLVADSKASLASLSVASTSEELDFSAGTYNYIINAISGDTVTINAQSLVKGATMTINGAPYTSGDDYKYEVTVGGEPVEIKITNGDMENTYTITFAPSAPAFSMVMHLNGESYQDQTIYQNNAAASGTVALSTEQAAFGTGSYAFDGSATNKPRMDVSPTNCIDVATENFTVSAWYYTNTTSGQHIIFWYGGYNASQPQFWCRTNGTSLQCCVASDGIETVLTASNAVTTGVWHHVVIIRDGVNIYMYQDNKLVASATSSLVHNINGEDGLTIGMSRNPSASARVVNGYLDEIKIFNYALNAEQIDSLYKTNTLPVVHVTGVTLDQTSASLMVGDNLSLSATVAPVNADDKTVTWSSDNEAVAIVDENGEVTAVAGGSAVITVTTKDGSHSASCSVNVVSGNIDMEAVRAAVKAAEAAQAAAEKAQKAAEEAAASAAEDKTAAEAAKAAAELAQAQAEAAKAAAETARTAAENAAKAAEESNAEAAKEAAAAAESAKNSAESASAAAGSAQTAAEAAKAAQDAQEAAETAQAAAEEAATSAAEDKAAAEAAKNAAELAKDQAETAKAAAETAQTAAENAAKAAEESNVEAAKEAAAAAESAKASADSASAAAGSAQTAAEAANNAQAAQAKVEAAQKAVEEAEENVAADREAVEQARKEAEAAAEAVEQAKKEAEAAIEQAKQEAEKTALSVVKYNALVELNEYADSLKEDASKVEQEALKAAVKAAREAINSSADEAAVAEALQAGIAALDEALCLAKNFTDVDLDEWYHDAIDFALHEGIMNGYGDGTFGPTDSLTRAMLVQILYNIEGRPEFETEKTFTDVNEGDWYYDAIMWAAENDIVLGYLDGSYGAKDIVTREQMVTILYRYAGKPEVTAAGIAFADSDQISDWAVDAVLWAYENKIVQGVGNKMFDPAGDSQRAAAAQIMMNYFMK